MARFSSSDDLQGAEFTAVDLTGARFRACDLSDVVMRAVDVNRMEIDAPWLPFGGYLRINDVDVIPLVEAELNRRFPGREERFAQDPEGLRAAWAKLEEAWAAARERVAAMPDGTVDASVDGEWSFAQTLRHLVFATDVWLRKAVLGIEDYHPLGQTNASAADDGVDMSVFVTGTPAYADVLEVSADREAMVRGFLATVTAEELAVPRPSPWDPSYQETTLSCLHTILEESWEHLRFAVRDLDKLEVTS